MVAHNEKDARAVAKAQFTGVSSSAWDNAECQEVQPPKDACGFQMVCALADDKGTVAEVVVVGVAHDTLDDMGVKCAKMLNDCDPIHGAAYNSTEHVLTVASAAGGDELGHCKVFCEVRSAGVTSGRASGIPGCVRSVMDQGEPGDSLTVVLAGPEYTLPCKVVAFGSGS